MFSLLCLFLLFVQLFAHAEDLSSTIRNHLQQDVAEDSVYQGTCTSYVKSRSSLVELVLGTVYVNRCNDCYIGKFLSHFKAFSLVNNLTESQFRKTYTLFYNCTDPQSTYPPTPRPTRVPTPATVVVNGVTCQCSCCTGQNCQPISVGSFQIAASACLPDACVERFPSQCNQLNGVVQTEYDSLSCFHKDTAVIEYKGKSYTFDEIRQHEECSIPHVVRTSGVKVYAKCMDGNKEFQLTGNHLVFTQNGLKAANELIPNADIVFADFAETKPCQVIQIEQKLEQSEYFGLNCYKSEVLVNGIKSSTFEKSHEIPAFWMQYVGGVVGIKRASVIGDFLVNFAQKWNLI